MTCHATNCQLQAMPHLLFCVKHNQMIPPHVNQPLLRAFKVYDERLKLAIGVIQEKEKCREV
jgi:hypothetical protein